MTNERFTVIDHNYMNTGGNTMVSIFTVYDRADKATRYVIANELGFNWQTADTVTNPDFTLDSDDMVDEIVLGCWNWEALITDPAPLDHQFEDDEWELFKYCQFEFYKKDCKYFNTKYRLSLNELPQDLFVTLPEPYVRWAEREGCGCLTDGFKLYMDDSYEPPVEEEREVPAEVLNFKKFIDDARYEQLTDDIIVAVAGRYVKLPLHADSFELLSAFIDKTIQEW